MWQRDEQQTAPCYRAGRGAQSAAQDVGGTVAGRGKSADQAPGLLDMSVIRNTNTKIILRLPDEEDRKLVGKSAALKEAQIDELSKLPLGVAAVYQNEWPEAVLCKIEAYPMPENAVYHKPSKMPHEINAEFVFGQLAAGKELPGTGLCRRRTGCG